MRYMERLKGHVLFSEKPLHAFQNGVLRRVYESVFRMKRTCDEQVKEAHTVWVVLGWDLEESRESLLVPIDRRSDLLCNLDRLE